VANRRIRIGQLVRFVLVGQRAVPKPQYDILMTTTAMPIHEVETQVLTPEASAFLTKLAREFEPRRRELLARRLVRQQKIDAGQMPEFLSETAHIREKEWTVAPIPQDLLDRRVEITGPVDRKMIINALNSGASVFMADFEDSNSPTWLNNLEGQANLRDAIDGTIRYKPRRQALRTQL
jgi:malate synthase